MFYFYFFVNNYYLYNNKSSWTMSPAGFASSGRSYVWGVLTRGGFDYDPVNYNLGLRTVLNLNADTQISDGDGTKENPFTIG